MTDLTMTWKTLKLELNPAWNIPRMKAMYEASYSEAIYQAWYEWKHMSPAEKNSHKPMHMTHLADCGKKGEKRGKKDE